jgi:hypothetical protein
MGCLCLWLWACKKPGLLTPTLYGAGRLDAATYAQWPIWLANFFNK